MQLAHATQNLISALLREHGAEFQDSFRESFSARFSEDSCAVAKAFLIFDPQKFPRETSREKSNFQKQITQYGGNHMKVLSEWYGTMKSNDEEKFDPVVDSQKVFQHDRARCKSSLNKYAIDTNL